MIEKDFVALFPISITLFFNHLKCNQSYLTHWRIKIYSRAHAKMKCSKRTLSKHQPSFANGYPVTKKTLKISNWLFWQFMHAKGKMLYFHHFVWIRSKTDGPWSKRSWAWTVIRLKVNGGAVKGGLPSLFSKDRPFFALLTARLKCYRASTFSPLYLPVLSFGVTLG